MEVSYEKKLSEPGFSGFKDFQEVKFTIFKGGASMETILNMVIDPDNVRMVLMVVLGWSGFVLINSKMARMEFSLNRV